MTNNNDLKHSISAVCIVEILKKYSDSENPMSAPEISDKLKEKYGISLGKRSVREKIKNIISIIDYCIDEFDYEILEESDSENKEHSHNDPKRWYYSNNFDDSEIRYLTSGLLFSKYIKDSERDDLIERLKKLASNNFDPHLISIKTFPLKVPTTDIFRNIDVLGEAIQKKEKVQFNFCSYDKKPGKNNAELVINEDANGKPKQTIVSPYSIVTANNKYYLLCSHDKGEKIYHYRLDHMKNITQLKQTSQRPINEFPEIKDKNALSIYMKEHIYMYGGDSVNVQVKIDKNRIDALIDWFGSEITIEIPDGKDVSDNVVARFRVNEKAMHYWALQYGNYVEILKPDSLKNEVIASIKKMASIYGID